MPGGPWSRTPFGALAPEALERLGVAQELDDLLQLVLGVVDAGDLVPADAACLTSGLIWTGFVFGISFSVRQKKKTIGDHEDHA